MSTIIGHQAVREALGRRIGDGRHVHQSFIFAGPDAVGKFLVAVEWFHRMSGVDTGPVADGSWRRNPDLIVVEPKTETVKGVIKERAIAVEDVRDVLRELALLPYGGHRRVLIVRDAHRLTEESQNALLKTLEEPPAYACIVLVTHEAGRLLPTIRSRCQEVIFRPVPPDTMREAFGGTGVPEAVLALGRPGLAVRYGDPSSGLGADMAVVDTLVRIDACPARERLALAETLSKDPARLSRILGWWLSVEVMRAFGDTAQASGAVGRAGRILDVLVSVRTRPGSLRSAVEDFLVREGSH